MTIAYDRQTFESLTPDDSNTQQSAFTMEDDDYSYFDSLQEGGTASQQSVRKEILGILAPS